MEDRAGQPPGFCTIMKNLKRFLPGIWIILAVILLAVCMWPGQLYLEIRDRQSGRLLSAGQVQRGSIVTLRFTHSVAKRPVDELWEVSADKVLILKETVYDSFGAGLPTDLGPGEKMEIHENYLRIYNMDRVLPSVNLAVGTIADHHLFYGAKQLRLSELAAPGTLITIMVTRHPFWWASAMRLTGHTRWP